MQLAAAHTCKRRRPPAAVRPEAPLQQTRTGGAAGDPGCGTDGTPPTVSRFHLRAPQACAGAGAPQVTLTSLLQALGMDSLLVERGERVRRKEEEEFAAASLEEVVSPSPSPRRTPSESTTDDDDHRCCAAAAAAPAMPPVPATAPPVSRIEEDRDRAATIAAPVTTLEPMFEQELELELNCGSAATHARTASPARGVGAPTCERLPPGKEPYTTAHTPAMPPACHNAASSLTASPAAGVEAPTSGQLPLGKEGKEGENGEAPQSLEANRGQTENGEAVQEVVRVMTPCEQLTSYSVNFVLFTPVENVPVDIRQCPLLQALGESIDDAIFMVLDREGFPVLLNSFGFGVLNLAPMVSEFRQLADISDTPEMRQELFYSHEYVRAVYPEHQREVVKTAFQLIHQGVIPSGGCHGRMLLCSDGVTRMLKWTSSRVFCKDTGNALATVHIGRLADVAEDDRILPIAEELSALLSQT
eukprot:TRINITY_DN3038_c0_g1_i1.p1 TRINITY_DN3038_c0_g1~~TRINITY_DN3038_c0_g1_i1.p1  ORF type:complete len:473 (-),score=94.12 TRINITY_DN3038_c0_g1_i1:103-1521(-)